MELATLSTDKSIDLKEYTGCELVNGIVYKNSPEDYILCFANTSNKIKHLSNRDLLQLFDRVNDLYYNFNIPSYIHKNSDFSYVNSNDIEKAFNEIKNIINSDIEHATKNRIILLETNESILSKRQNSRGVIKNKSLEQYYSSLRQYMTSNKTEIKFTDIGLFSC